MQANNSYEGYFNYKYVESADIPAFSSFQDSLAKEDHDLIICIGFLQTSALNVTARTYTDKNFVLIDDVIDLPNVKSITFKEHEGSFLVGAMAVMTTENEKIGFLGGLDIYLINKFLAGYEQGAHYINENISITARYSPDSTNPWGDIAGSKVIGGAFIDQGCDNIYSAAGGTGVGIMQAVNETTGVYAIGVDYDQDYLFEGKILTSMIKKVDTAVFYSISGIFDNLWTPNNIEMGLAMDGVGLSNMTYTHDVKIAPFKFYGMIMPRMSHITDLRVKIIKGTIIVNEIPSDKPTTEETTTEEITTISTTDVMTTETTTDSSTIISTIKTTIVETSDETSQPNLLNTPGWELGIFLVAIIFVITLRKK